MQADGHAGKITLLQWRLKCGFDMYNKGNLFARPGKLKMSKHQELLQEFRIFAETAANATALMTHISQRLHR